VAETKSSHLSTVSYVGCIGNGVFWGSKLKFYSRTLICFNEIKKPENNERVQQWQLRISHAIRCLNTGNSEPFRSETHPTFRITVTSAAYKAKWLDEVQKIYIQRYFVFKIQRKENYNPKQHCCNSREKQNWLNYPFLLVTRFCSVKQKDIC
jgi:hypothetical protein